MNLSSATDNGLAGTASAAGSRATQPLVAPSGDCHFGVEVLGVDLTDLGTGDLEWIRQVWSDNPLLLIRWQLLTEHDLMDFSRFFGELEVVVRKDIHSRHNPEIALVSNLYLEDGSNIGGLGTYELRWHSDQSYRTRPATGAVFYALEIPPARSAPWMPSSGTCRSAGTGAVSPPAPGRWSGGPGGAGRPPGPVCLPDVQHGHHRRTGVPGNPGQNA